MELYTKILETRMKELDAVAESQNWREEAIVQGAKALRMADRSATCAQQAARMGRAWKQLYKAATSLDPSIPRNRDEFMKKVDAEIAERLQDNT